MLLSASSCQYLDRSASMAYGRGMPEVHQRVSGPFEIGPKGRSVVPAAVRKAAGVSERDKLTAYADGPGRIVLETPEAVQSRVWAAAGEKRETNAVRNVAAIRAQEVAVADANFARRSIEPDEGSADAAGQRLLTTLGL